MTTYESDTLVCQFCGEEKPWQEIRPGTGFCDACYAATTNGSEPAESREAVAVTLEEFVAVTEAGAEAVMGEADSILILIPEGGDELRRGLNSLEVDA